MVASSYKLRVGILDKDRFKNRHQFPTFLKGELLPRVATLWEQVQEYTFCIEYRPGKMITHFGAMSFNPVSDSAQLSQDSQTVFLGSELHRLATIQSHSEVPRIIGILKDPKLDDVVQMGDSKRGTLASSKREPGGYW